MNLQKSVELLTNSVRSRLAEKMDYALPQDKFEALVSEALFHLNSMVIAGSSKNFEKALQTIAEENKP